MSDWLHRLLPSRHPDAMGSDAWLVVGLGNPGPSYAATRHNVGQRVCDVVAARLGEAWRRHRSGRADVVETRFRDHAQAVAVRTVLAKLRSYMNDSGGPVAALAAYYKVPPERLVVVHDELDLPFGCLRVKFGGGDNGHNGLKSIRAALSTGDFHRVRFGIGRPRPGQAGADYVLEPFSSAERKQLEDELARGADAVESLVLRGLARTQTDFNLRGAS